MTLGDRQVIEGSLGGLHVMDVTPEDISHRTVLRVGCTETEQPKRCIFQESDTDEDSKKAFTFTLVKPKEVSSLVHEDTCPPGSDSLSKHIRLSVHMASAHYTYTHRFISELSLCVGDFSSYANAMAQSLRSAATTMAIGLVTKQTSLADGIDYFSAPFAPTAGTPLYPKSPSRRGSFSSCDGLDTSHVGRPSSAVEKRRVYVHLTIETPVINLPRTANSSECLVAQLGRIVVYNTHLTSYDQNIGEISVENSFNDIDRVYVDITDMSLYSLGMTNDAAETRPSLSDYSGIGDDGEHILHDTAIRLVIDRCCGGGPGDEESENSASKPTIHLLGRVTKPLQLVLSNSAYQQLLSTMDTLSGKTERDYAGSSVPSTASSRVTSPLISPALVSINNNKDLFV